MRPAWKAKKNVDDRGWELLADHPGQGGPAVCAELPSEERARIAVNVIF